MCIALATWHLIQKLKTNYINHPRWGALQEINLLPLLPEEKSSGSRAEANSPKLNKTPANAPCPRQIPADPWALCAGTETLPSHGSRSPGLASVICKNPVNSLTLVDNLPGYTPSVLININLSDAWYKCDFWEVAGAVFPGV